MRTGNALASRRRLPGWGCLLLSVVLVVLVVSLGILYLKQYKGLGLVPPRATITPAATNGALRNQGVYESCAPSSGQMCLDRLQQIARGGFRLVINYSQMGGSASQELAYARQANNLGMKVIWNLSEHVWWNGTDLLNYFPGLAATCDCSDNQSFIRYFITLIKDLPGTWGYYVGDEVGPMDHDAVKAFADLVHEIDTHHPRLFISCAQCDRNASEHPYIASLLPMADVADVLGSDWYPVGTGVDDIQDTGRVASAVQQVADQNKKQSAMVLQAFNWVAYPKSYHSCMPYPDCMPYPTTEQMQQMLDLTIGASQPEIILWYSYYDILRSDNPIQHWQDLIAATHR